MKVPVTLLKIGDLLTGFWYVVVAVLIVNLGVLIARSFVSNTFLDAAYQALTILSVLLAVGSIGNSEYLKRQRNPKEHESRSLLTEILTLNP